MPIKTLKVRLYPTEPQKVLLEKHFGANRFIWNYFLQKRTEYYAESKKNGKSQGMNYLMTAKLLTELKKDKDWLYEVSNASLQQTLRKLDNAFTSFFRKNTSYPTFKTKRDNQWFVVPNYIRIRENYLLILKFKEGIRFRDKYQISKDIKQVSITKEVERYYASIFYESDEKLEKGTQQIGIDLGLKTFATLSNGIQIENPHLIDRYERRIKRQQKKLVRKKKGSNNYRKQSIKIARLHQNLRDSRRDFLHKASTAIAKLSDTIVMEDLNIQGTMQNHKLARGISDVSWYQFKRMLIYKSKWRGIEFIEIGRFDPSSKICSKCGWYKSDLELSDRIFHCDKCGLEIDRDLNASINIRNMGLIKVGRGTPEFTPVESATAAELLNRGGLRVATL